MRQAGAATSKKPRSASAISRRTGSPDTTTSTIVSELWVWPRAVIERMGVVGGPVPQRARLGAAVSLVGWLAALTLGRLVGYF